MSKPFKVGDKVVRTKKIDGKTMRGEVVTTGPGPAINIKLTEGAGLYNAGDIYGGSVYFWEVVEEADELPPVPDSVMYFNSVRDDSNDQHLVLELTDRSDEWADEATGHIGLKVVPRTSSTRAGMAIGINLTPDAALQLAHDLRRMAMEIKRKEKLNA